MKPILFILTLLLLASCVKERDATFTTDKDVYALGEPVVITPTYMNVDNYDWEMGNGKSSKEAQPETYSYSKTGNFTIRVEASHKRSMRKSVEYSKNINVYSWTIDSIRLNSIPSMMSWDNNSGPDLRIKMNDPSLKFNNIFTSDFSFDFPENLDTSDMPFMLRSLEETLFFADWEIRVLEEDLPLPNTEMLKVTFNPYLTGSNGLFKIQQAGYDIEFFCRVNQ